MDQSRSEDIDAKRPALPQQHIPANFQAQPALYQQQHQQHQASSVAVAAHQQQPALYPASHSQQPAVLNSYQYQQQQAALFQQQQHQQQQQQLHQQQQATAMTQARMIPVFPSAEVMSTYPAQQQAPYQQVQPQYTGAAAQQFPPQYQQHISQQQQQLFYQQQLQQQQQQAALQQAQIAAAVAAANFQPKVGRLPADRPLIKLSISLIDTYKHINTVYYEERDARRAARKLTTGSTTTKGANNNGWDDDNYDYIVTPGELFYGRYKIMERIGKGSFGQVVRAEDMETKREVAIKIIKSKKPFLLQAKTEIELLTHLFEKDPEDQHNIGMCLFFVFAVVPLTVDDRPLFD
jgi:hypothetical protein